MPVATGVSLVFESPVAELTAGTGRATCGWPMGPVGGKW